MFDVPMQYHVGSKIEPKTFTTKDMKKPVRERVMQNLLETTAKAYIISHPKLKSSDALYLKMA
jgi:hypothetical protein